MKTAGAALLVAPAVTVSAQGNPATHGRDAVPDYDRVFAVHEDTMRATDGAPEGQKMERPRVLVADDDDALLSLMVELMEEEGFDVVSAPDGATAALLAAGRQFDVLLLDDDMPGLRGSELIERLRAEGSAVPVVLVSGSLAMDEDDQRRLDITAVLPKPVPTAVLARTMRRALRRVSGQGNL